MIGATVLTLVVTPAALMAIENLRLMRLRWFAKLSPARSRRSLTNHCLHASISRTTRSSAP